MEYKDRTFDVAKWSLQDIYEAAASKGYSFDQDELESVVDYLSNNFDAGIGINWVVIEEAIDYIIEEIKNETHNC